MKKQFHTDFLRYNQSSCSSKGSQRIKYKSISNFYNKNSTFDKRVVVFKSFSFWTEMDCP